MVRLGQIGPGGRIWRGAIYCRARALRAWRGIGRCRGTARTDTGSSAWRSPQRSSFGEYNVTFLASDGAAMVSGASYEVTGGDSAKDA